jgi:hypothetical protein
MRLDARQLRNLAAVVQERTFNKAEGGWQRVAYPFGASGAFTAGTPRSAPRHSELRASIFAVCQNRNLWGVSNFEALTIRHSKFAAARFAHQVAPALTHFANSSPIAFVDGIKAAYRCAHRRGTQRHARAASALVRATSHIAVVMRLGCFTPAPRETRNPNRACLPNCRS